MEVKQYQIVLVNLDPTVGKEINKTRPCVIISPDEMNKYLGTVIIAPMTTTHKKYPTRVSIHHNNLQGSVVIDQIRTIDKKRILKVLGIVNHQEIQNIKMVIKETLVD